MTAQAAASAILTVTAAGGEVGPQRLVDALIGAGVALVFSQILFSPKPIALVRRAEASALARIADGLERAARALERCDDELAADAVSDLRAVRDDLAEVSRATRASSRVTRRTLLWRSRRAPVVRENENAAHLDLLAGSCLMLARAAREVSRSERRLLAPSVRALTDAIAGMSSDPGDRDARQRAVDQALAATRSVPVIRGQSESMLAAVVAVRMVAADVLVFAGVDPRQVPLDGAPGVPRQDH